MIIEAGSDALRLDVALGNDGRAISATVVPVDKWITNEKQASREAKSKEGEDENDGYKTEDEVEMAYPSRKPKTHDRIVTHDDLNRFVLIAFLKIKPSLEKSQNYRRAVFQTIWPLFTRSAR